MINYRALALSIAVTLAIFTVTLMITALIMSKNILLISITVGAIIFLGFFAIGYTVYEVLK